MHTLKIHFSVAYFLVAIGLMVVDAILQLVAQVRFPDPAGVVTLIPAVWYAGSRYAEHNDSMPQPGPLWMLSLELALIATVISLAIAAALMLFFSGSEAMSDFDSVFEMPFPLLVTGLFFSALIAALVIRFSLPMAIRSGFKRPKR